MAAGISAETRAALELWREHCKEVQSLTEVSLGVAKESPAERDKRILRLLNNYASFCEYYFPHFLTLRDKTTGDAIRIIHNAPFHNKAALKVKTLLTLKPSSNGLVVMPNLLTLTSLSLYG